MPPAQPVEPTVADHFPRRPKQCAKPADAFFACFTAKGEQPPGGDKEAGRRGLAECRKEMAAYDACMVKFLGGRQRPSEEKLLFRVQEEYRAGTLAAAGKKE